MLWLCLLFLFTNIFYMSVSTSNESKVKQSYISSILEINQKYPLLNQICENLGPESTNPESTNIFSKTFAENKRDIDNINELINACEKIAKDEYPDYGSIHKNLIGQINELSNRISKRHKNMFTSPINSLNAPSRHGLPPFQHQELLQPHPLHIQQSKIFQPYEISNNLPKQHITGHTIPINQLMSQNIPFMHENQNFSHQQQQHNAEIHEKRTLDEYPYLPENVAKKNKQIWEQRGHEMQASNLAIKPLNIEKDKNVIPIEVNKHLKQLNRDEAARRFSLGDQDIVHPQLTSTNKFENPTLEDFDVNQYINEEEGHGGLLDDITRPFQGKNSQSIKLIETFE